MRKKLIFPNRESEFTKEDIDNINTVAISKKTYEDYKKNKYDYISELITINNIELDTKYIDLKNKLFNSVQNNDENIQYSIHSLTTLIKDTNDKPFIIYQPINQCVVNIRDIWDVIAFSNHMNMPTSIAPIHKAHSTYGYDTPLETNTLENLLEELKFCPYLMSHLQNDCKNLHPNY